MDPYSLFVGIAIGMLIGGFIAALGMALLSVSRDR